MSGITDRDAAARYGVDPPRDWDHGERYDGQSALFPKGWDDMDAGRFTADGCWAALTAQKLIGSNVPRWKVSCRHCRGVWHGWSEQEAMQKARVAHGDA